jgi:hypothetical protein
MLEMGLSILHTFEKKVNFFCYMFIYVIYNIVRYWKCGQEHMPEDYSHGNKTTKKYLAWYSWMHLEGFTCVPLELRNINGAFCSVSEAYCGRTYFT